ncbi:MAG TPA: dihydropteroate synthase [Thermomicrobiales bacterium]|jgi:dihydropteroate synthase
MAVVNATPDSFGGDGIGDDVEAAIRYAVDAEAEGTDIIDVGGESTRPRHTPVDATEELRRLLPVVRAIAGRVTLPISVDTSKAAVAEAALDAGAGLVNDVRGFTRDPELAQVVARRGVRAVLMHDVAPDGQGDLVTSVVRELSRRLDRAVAAGIAWEKLIVDPGFGFGKDWRQNLELLRRLGELRVLGRPILVGLSRKSTIGRVLGLDESDRLEGTLATTALAIANGADVVRVHDVRANVRVARMTDAVVRRAPTEAKSWPGGPPP